MAAQKRGNRGAYTTTEVQLSRMSRCECRLVRRNILKLNGCFVDHGTNNNFCTYCVPMVFILVKILSESDVLSSSNHMHERNLQGVSPKGFPIPTWLVIFHYFIIKF